MAAADEPTRAEVMAVAIARRLRDGETIAVGSVSPIPAGACLLAKRLHAPGRASFSSGAAITFPSTAACRSSTTTRCGDGSTSSSPAGRRSTATATSTSA